MTKHHLNLGGRISRHLLASGSALAISFFIGAAAQAQGASQAQNGGAATADWTAIALASDPVVTAGSQAQDGKASPAASGTQVAANDQVTNSGNGGIETVVVTARLRAENSQDVPVSLHALSGSDLTRDNTDSLQLLQAKLPSVSINTSNPRQSSVAIRGVGLTQSNDGQDSSTGIFIDGVYQARPGESAFDLEDIADIQVLRGPQGTLFGRNTVSGALVIETKAPVFRDDAGVEADAGSFGLIQAKGFYNTTLSDDLAIRISAWSNRQDGFVHDITTGGNDGQRNDVGVRIQALYQPNDDFRYRVIYSYDRQDFVGIPATITGVVPTKGGALNLYQRLNLASPGYVPPSNPYAHTTDFNAFHDNIGYKHTLTGIGDLNLGGGYTFTSVTNATYWRYNPYNDQDQTYLDGEAQFGSPNTTLQYSQEFRLASPSDQSVEWVAGAIYFHSRIGWDLGQLDGSQFSYFSPQLSNANLALLAPPNNNLNTLGTVLNGALAGYTTNQKAAPTTDSGALFGQGTWKATDRLSLTLGLRASYDYRWAHLLQGNSIASAGTNFGGLSTPINGLALPPTLAGVPVGGYTQAQYLALYGSYFNSPAAATTLLNAGRGSPPASQYASSSLWNGSGNASISYKLDDGILAYATYSRGYKGAGISTSIVAAGIPQVTKPETINDYEVGLKTSLLDNHLIFNADLFWENYKNYQANISGYNSITGLSAAYLGNIGLIVSRGLETDITWLPIDGLRIDANGSYDEAYYGSNPNLPCSVEASVAGQTSCNLAGRVAPYAPRWIASLTGEYDYPLADGNELYGVGTYAYRSGAYLSTDFTNSIYTWAPGYSLTNLRAGIRIGNHWDLSVFANNVFDTHYATGTSISSTLYYKTVTQGVPLNYGITARFAL